MGFAASPYSSVKMVLIVEEVCRGNWHEEGLGLDGKELNLFQWKFIRLNLQGTKDYDPCHSWILKMQLDGCVVCDILSFVDDEHVGGQMRTSPGRLVTSWQAHRVILVCRIPPGRPDCVVSSQVPGQEP